jgi:hypothetical protein
MNLRRTASFAGWLWIVTFVTSIPARFVFYAPVIDKGNYVAGAGDDAKALIAMGALLELLLIISNVGTAVVPFSIHKRVNEAGAVAFVTARLVECTFIAIGIVLAPAAAGMIGPRRIEGKSTHRGEAVTAVGGAGPSASGSRSHAVVGRLNAEPP